MTILVVGFGPFGTFAENPAAKLARSVDGATVGSLLVVGREMPVSYRRAVEVTEHFVRENSPAFILGIGVAAGRAVALVEERAVNLVMPGRPDVDGEIPGGFGEGAEELLARDTPRLAEALGVGTSQTAGEYVCNGWLYQVLRLGHRAGFLHVPPAGFPSHALIAGFARFADHLAG